MGFRFILAGGLLSFVRLVGENGLLASKNTQAKHQNPRDIPYWGMVLPGQDGAVTDLHGEGNAGVSERGRPVFPTKRGSFIRRK
jgi:hypothetical protein